LCAENTDKPVFFGLRLFKPLQGATSGGCGITKAVSHEQGIIDQNLHVLFLDASFCKRSSRYVRTASIVSSVAAPVDTSIPSSSLSGVIVFFSFHHYLITILVKTEGATDQKDRHVARVPWRIINLRLFSRNGKITYF